MTRRAVACVECEEPDPQDRSPARLSKVASAGFRRREQQFVVPVDCTYLFGATQLYKVNSSTAALMRGRLVQNGATDIRGSRGEISSAQVSEATALWLHTMAALTAGDTVELQGNFRAADGYFAVDQTSFWGVKVG